VPPNLARYLPLILIAFFALLIVPTLLKKKHTSGPNASTRAAQTIDAMNRIDKGEQRFRTAHGGYTSHLADLVPDSHGLARDLVIGLGVDLDAGTRGQSFYARVESDVLILVRARDGTKLVARTCLVLKSSSGVKC
jgi:hypothetical protein